MDATDTNSEFAQLTAEPPARISTPMASSGGPSPNWNQPKTNSGTLNVARAQHIVKKLTDDPSWLIDPSTSHAAQAVFGAASKVIGMNIQLERASNSSLAAREEQAMVAKQVKMASEIVSANPNARLADGRPVSAMWVKNQDGMAAIMDISNLGEISSLHGQHVKPTGVDAPGDLVGIEIQMPDKSTVQAIRNTHGKGYTVVPKKGDTETAIAAKETSKKIAHLESDARELEKKYMAANAEYVESMSGRKVEGQSQKAIKDKADYFRTQQMNKVRQVEALRNPTATTNAPAASAPEKLRVKGPNGQTGTVPKGASLPEGWTLE